MVAPITIERVVNDAASVISILVGMAWIYNVARKTPRNLQTIVVQALSVILITAAIPLSATYGLKWFLLTATGLALLSINFVRLPSRSAIDYVALVWWYTASSAWYNYLYTNWLVLKLGDAFIAGMHQGLHPPH